MNPSRLTASGFKRGTACTIAALLLAAASSTSCGQARADEPCDRVVSYFRYQIEGNRFTHHEWRIFDPSRRMDVLFLKSSGGFSGVRWDTTFRNAFYSSADSLYRVEWKLGAIPRFIGRLPETHDPEDWWFNPDSSCWQLAALRPVGTYQTADRYWCELWQSTRDVASWRVVRSDTVACEDGDCGSWPWYDEAWARQAPAVTAYELSIEATANSWDDQVERFDTTTVTISSDGEGESEWLFIPSKSSPRHGVAFRVLYSSDTVVSGPYFFVDLDRRTKVLIPTAHLSHGSWTASLLSDHCGLILGPEPEFNPSLLDGTTGRVVFSTPANSTGAVWVSPPRR